MSVEALDPAICPQLSELIALRSRVQAWPPPLRARAGLSGLASSPFRGRGMEFAETRMYTRGDDVRHVDWRVTARTGKLHTKVFHAERERMALLVADTSAGLYFGTRCCYKSVQAARAAAIVAWAAQRSGDRIGILRGADAEPPLVPTAGVRGVLRVLDAAVRWYVKPPVDDSGLAAAFTAAARLLRPGARVIALVEAHALHGVSDVQLAGLAAHHEVLVVLLTDPIETAPPAITLPVQVGGKSVRLDLSARADLARWQHSFAGTLSAARARLTRYGIRSHTLSTTDAAESLLPLLMSDLRQ